ncbi:MAG TPA: hypothetical protein VGN35_00865 [Jatrophihabitantaceae bacterium]|nr:hypothetical protein [Jatrophihabitantaceae bacterium]
MSTPVVLRAATNVFRDRRNDGRALRVTWHPVDDVFVLSTWRGEICASTFQINRSDVPDLLVAFARGLADRSSIWSAPSYSPRPDDRVAARETDGLRRRLSRFLGGSGT